MIFMIVFFVLSIWALIFDELWHQFWFHFGIPLALNSMFSGDSFWDVFGNRFLIDFDSKSLPKVSDGTTFFTNFVDPVAQVVFLKVHLFTLAPFGYLLILFWSPSGPLGYLS